MNCKRSTYHQGLKVALLICTTLASPITQAEIFGSLIGRTASFAAHPQITVEAALSNGEFESADYQRMGVRLNYQYTSEIVLFGDVGKSKLESESETAIGFGAFYSLGKSILGSEDSALKVSAHQAKFSSYSSGGGLRQVCRPSTNIHNDIIDTTAPLDCSAVPSGSGGSSGGGDVRNIAFELLISGGLTKLMPDDNASWYANAGLQMLSGDLADDRIFGIGAGIVLPLGASEVYAGFEVADETFIGLGYRYFVE